MASTGYLSTPPSHDIAALCGTQVALGDRTANKIAVWDVKAGAAVKSFQIGASPGDIDLDAKRGLVYATLAPATFLARISLLDGTTSARASSRPVTRTSPPSRSSPTGVSSSASKPESPRRP